MSWRKVQLDFVRLINLVLRDVTIEDALHDKVPRELGPNVRDDVLPSELCLFWVGALADDAGREVLWKALRPLALRCDEPSFARQLGPSGFDEVAVEVVGKSLVAAGFHPQLCRVRMRSDVLVKILAMSVSCTQRTKILEV